MNANTKTRTYTYFQDPGHGWVQVPVKELEELDIEDQISSFSYYKNKMVYLEEDSDAPKFFKALESRNIEYKVNEVHQNEESIIRSYRHF